MGGQARSSSDVDRYALSVAAHLFVAALAVLAITVLSAVPN